MLSRPGVYSTGSCPGSTRASLGKMPLSADPSVTSGVPGVKESGRKCPLYRSEAIRSAQISEKNLALRNGWTLSDAQRILSRTGISFRTRRGSQEGKKKSSVDRNSPEVLWLPKRPYNERMKQLTFACQQGTAETMTGFCESPVSPKNTLARTSRARQVEARATPSLG